MKQRIYLMLLYFGIFNIFPGDIDKNILEQAYFDLSGIWAYDNVGDIIPLWVRSRFFSWGYVKDYDPEAGAIIDLGVPKELTDLYKYSSIEKQDNLYKFRIQEPDGYAYILIKEKGKISFQYKPDSVTGDYSLRRLTGPDRDFVNHVGVLKKATDIHVLPSKESNVSGRIGLDEEVLIAQRTIKDEIVTDFIPWIKIKTDSGEEGWILADDVNAEMDEK